MITISRFERDTLKANPLNMESIRMVAEVSERLLVKAPQAAEMLAISQRLLWSLTNRGDVPCLRIGRSVRYDVTDLRSWIESKKCRS